MGYHEKIESLEEFEKKYPGLYLTGAFRGGVSVEDCIANGKATADKAAQFASDKNFTPSKEIINV